MKNIKNIFRNDKSRLFFLEKLREKELMSFIKSLTNKNLKILEIGAGAGWQSKRLNDLGFCITAVDVHNSNYKNYSVYPIIFYDGVNLPFNDLSFDVIYSSHTLEHVKNLDALLKEMYRVLKPGGFMYHSMPSSSWQFWSLLANFLRIQSTYGVLRDLFVNHTIFPRHGEIGNSLTEMFYFRKNRWKKIFLKNGFVLTSVLKGRLFYTGKGVLNERLNFKNRTIISYFLGSSSNIFIVEK